MPDESGQPEGEGGNQHEKKSPLETQFEIQKAMDKIKFKLVSMSGKGGVGKTTVAVNLAIRLAALGRTVGLLDVDITGPNVAIMLGLQGQRPIVDQEERKFYPVQGPLDMKVLSMAFLTADPDQPVIWRGPLKMQAVRQFLMDCKWGSLDYLVIDLPPGTGDETLDIMQLIPDSRPIIVTTPQDVALLDSRKTVSMVKIMKKAPLGVIENMAGFICPHCGKETLIFGKGGGERAATELGVPFLGRIPLEMEVREQGDTGMPIVMKDPESASGKAFLEIAKKIMDACEKSS
ncbi:MAG: Mrp/NBP35 family ATP-binding protein [Promethearchaeota archaeon]